MPTEETPTRIGVIMAGGSGERFWPLSRTHRPKQLLRPGGSDRTLLEEACDRLAPSVPRERVFVATGAHLAAPIAAAGIVPPDNVLVEPAKRNTAGCLVWVAAQCLARFGNQAEDLSLAVVTADHRVDPPERFTAAVDAALAAAEAAPVLATIGIVPTRPETGFGYIEVGGPDADAAADVPVARPVVRFVEKPDQDTAARLVASGRYLWNSGMFFFRLRTFLEQLQLTRPDMSRMVRDLAPLVAAGAAPAAAALFATLEDVSIDYALMEKAPRVVVVPGRFGWDDIGSLEALARCLGIDAQGNTVTGEAVVLDSRNCVVINDPGAARMAVGVVGMEGVAVIVTEDAVLVVPKGRGQQVRQVVAELRRRGARQI